MNKFNILIAMLVCLNICGCSDFLEEDPKGKLTTDNFYNSESDARQAINGVYRRLSDSWVTGYNIKQIPNDLLKRASWDEASGLSNFTYGSENTYIAGMWQNHYAVIKDCNSVIDNVTANKEKINNWERYVGQAHGIRAFLYFDLVRWFGDVPLVLTDTKSLDGLEVTRTPGERSIPANHRGFRILYQSHNGQGRHFKRLSIRQIDQRQPAMVSWLKYIYGWVA